MRGLYGVASFDPNIDVSRVCAGLRAVCSAHDHRYDDQSHLPWGTKTSGQPGAFILAPGKPAEGPVSITLAGWVSEIEGEGPCPADPACLHAQLADLYRRDGLSFVDRLYGSFAMVLVDLTHRRICLFADHCSSRPLYWTVRDGQLIWASNVSWLLGLPGKSWALSLSSVASFLSCGHHLGEDTWVEGVQRIPPGQGVMWSSSGVQRHSYFRHCPGADADPDSNVDGLADDLAEAVLQGTRRCLRVSSAPVVTLSGGLDSRLVLGSLLRAGGGAGIRTTTWGCEHDYVHGDAHVAARLASALGLEHRFIDRNDDYLSLPAFTRVFGAETDAATYHIGEIDVLDRLLGEGWSRSLYRGDECFGWLGKVASPEEAMAAVGIRPLDRLGVRLDDLFCDDVWARMRQGQLDCLGRLTSTSPPADPVDLKDRFYFEHRLARYLHPSSEYKRSRVEVFNPLLDKDILNVLRRVPARLRLHKRIEVRLMERHFPYLMTMPLASRASIPDATRRWREDPRLGDFMVSTLREEGRVWSRLVRPDRLAAFATRALNGIVPAAGGFRWMAGRLLRTSGMYDRYKRWTWRPLDHAQPSTMQLLQRLLAMRTWLRLYEEHITLEF